MMIQKPFSNRNQLNDDKRYMRRVSYLSINSKDRDRTKYPQPQSYQVDLRELAGIEFRNVESIRILHGEVPDLNNIGEQPYLVLCIEQLQDTYTRHYSTSNISNFFDFLTFSDNFRQNQYIFIKEGKQIFFKPTLAKLSKLNIQIKDQEGNLFSWGDDSGGNFDIQRQHQITFEVTELVQDINSIRPSNVY